MIIFGSHRGSRGSRRVHCRASRIAAAILLLLAVPAAGATAPPRLRIEAPGSLAAEAEQLRRVGPRQLAAIGELVGIEDPGPPIRVVLAPEGSPLAREAPPWASGYAYSATGVVVLIPERELSYPDESLEDLLRHEIAHVLVDRAAGGRQVPRWFDEGVATIAGSSWGVGDRARLTLAVILGGPDSLAELDRSFRGDRRQASRAYALSGAFVRDLIQSRGRGVVGSILRLRSEGRPFPGAFRRATGMTLARAEEAFWERRALWNRWVPIVTSSLSLWVAITLLALLAFRRRRARDAAIEARWREQEEARWREQEEARREEEGPVGSGTAGAPPRIDREEP